MILITLLLIKKETNSKRYNEWHKIKKKKKQQFSSADQNTLHTGSLYTYDTKQKKKYKEFCIWI